jgi:hypothetical protein
VNEGVRAHVFGAEIDCSAENILQYCAANAAIGAHLEWLIEQCTGAIGDEMESAFQTVFDKLDNLTKKVDKMALEEVALCKAYRQSTAETTPGKPKATTPKNSDPPLHFQQPPGNRQIFERILVQQPQFTFAQHFQTRSTLFCRVTR